MDQGPPENKELGKEQKRLIMITLAMELRQSPEAFPFPGIEEKAHDRMKATDLEFPDITTPIDEILRRMEAEGMKVALGKNPASGNVYILPWQSNDIGNDSISPKDLKINKINNGKLRALVLATKEWEMMHKKN